VFARDGRWKKRGAVQIFFSLEKKEELLDFQNDKEQEQEQQQQFYFTLSFSSSEDFFPLCMECVLYTHHHHLLFILT
jgi:hypothetical protein